jgi:hypothetical protein
LSGFTDAEGCFSVKIGNEKAKFYVRFLYILDQKNEHESLNKIAKLFNNTSKAVIRTPNIKNPSINMYRVSISCNNLKKTESNLLGLYFSKFPLKTSKKSSFEI